MEPATALVKFRHGMTGEDLSIMRFPVSVEVDALRARAAEALAASELNENRACGSLSFVMDGRVLPDKGLLEDFYTTTHSGDDHLVIDVVQRYGLELQLRTLNSSAEAFRNRAFVSQADFAKLIPQGHDILCNRLHVQVADKILCLEGQEHCPVGEIRFGQLLREFCGCEIEEKLLVSHSIPSDACELRNCSMQVMAAGGFFVAPTLRERVRIPREALRTALKEHEGQIFSIDQPLLLQPEIYGPFIKLVFAGGTENCSANHARDRCLHGWLRPDTQVHFIEADESVRLV